MKYVNVYFYNRHIPIYILSISTIIPWEYYKTMRIVLSLRCPYIDPLGILSTTQRVKYSKLLFIPPSFSPVVIHE